MQKIRFVAREKPDARPDSKSLQLPVTLVIYGDEERYDYFAGQGHHVSPFYFRYLWANLIAQSSGEPVRAEESFADGGRAIGCKLFKTIQAKPLPVDAAAEALLGDLSFDQPQAPLSRTFCNELCPGERLSKVSMTGRHLIILADRYAGEVGTASHIWLEQLGRSSRSLQPGVSKVVG